MNIESFKKFVGAIDEKKTTFPDLGETIAFETEVKVGKKTFAPNTEFEVTDKNEESIELTLRKDSSYFTMADLKANSYYLV